MTKIGWICCVALLASSAGARAEDKAAAPAGAMDMSKMGPMSRPVTKEKEDKKGVDDLYKTMMDAWKKGDVVTVAENLDFPVIMLSDDSSGASQHFEASRDVWLGDRKSTR